MRFVLTSCLLLTVCQQNAASVPPEASIPPSAAPAAPAAPAASTASAASTPTSSEAACEAIRKRWEKQLERFVGQHHTCKGDEDCVCYGGPVCPNALVKTCPSPVRRDIAEALEPFMEEWASHRCPILWSPYGCQAKCAAGRCTSTK